MYEVCAICKKMTSGMMNSSGIWIPVHPECMKEAEIAAGLRDGTVCPTCRKHRKSKTAKMCASCRAKEQARAYRCASSSRCSTCS